MSHTPVYTPSLEDAITHQSDFDGCLIKGPFPTINSHALLHIYAVRCAVGKKHGKAEHGISKALWVTDFLRYGFGCIYSELKSSDNAKSLSCIARLLDGVRFSDAADYVARRIMPKEKSLRKIRKLFPERRLVLGIISNNDPDLIVALNNRRLQYELSRWDIAIDNSSIIGNTYQKEDGRYTGSIDVLVGPDKQRHFIDGMIYFADFTDYMRYRQYPNVIKIP